MALCLGRGHNGIPNFSQRLELITRARPSFEDEAVSIFDEAPGLAVFQCDGLSAIPRQFEHTAPARAVWAADGAAGEDVACTHWAAIGGVVNELLADVPVQVLVVGAGEQCAAAIRSLQPGFQGDVEMGGADALQIGQGLGVLHRPFDSERFQVRQRHDSIAHGCCKVLSEEGSERDVFPGLDVAGGPVVDEHEAFDVAVGLGHGNGLAALGVAADDHADLELEVEFAGGAEGDAAVSFLALAGGPIDGLTARNDAAGAPVIGHGHVLPVGQQRVLRVAEHLAHVPGMVFRRIEVREFTPLAHAH